MVNPLEKEFEYYIKNQKDLIKKYNGKFIVIKDEKVIGSYDDELTAIEKTSETEKMGTFLVQKCAPGEDNYTQTYHSRVTFI